MAYNPRHSGGRKGVQSPYPKDRMGRRLFPSLEELGDWERIMGSFSQKGSFVRKVRIEASLGYPAEPRYERVYWGR